MANRKPDTRLPQPAVAPVRGGRAPAPSAPWAGPLAPLAAGLLAFIAYAALCPPVSGMGDGSEFTLVLATLGVAHPTGYPLYTLAGHAFVTLLHPFGVSYPLAANLWSAVGGGVAIGFLFALALRLAGAATGANATTRLLAALVPTALFAVHPALLPDATAGEVNSWSAAWVCAAAFVFVAVLDRLPRRSASGGRRSAAEWGLVCGLGLAHHAASVLVAAPLTLALLVALARRRARPLPWLVVAGAVALVPLASYGFLAWRAFHPGIVQWPTLVPSLASLRDHVTGEQYRHYLGYFAPAPDQREIVERDVLPCLAVGLAALVALAWRARDAAARIAALALLAAALLVTGFAFRYGVPDPVPYFVPALALGAAAVAPALAGLALPRVRGAAFRLAAVALASLFVIVPWVRREVGRNLDMVGYEKLVRSMWSAVPPDTAIVFWPDDRYQLLREYQLLRGERPAALVLCNDLLLEDRTRAMLRARFGADPLAGHPIPYIAPGSPDEAARIAAYTRAVLTSFNARIRPPVILFDPSVPTVWQMDKPREAAPRPDASPGRR